MTIAGLIFLFVYNFIVHGIMLKTTYDLTPQMWRTAEEMKSFFVFNLLIQAAMAYISASLYGRFARSAGVGEGIRFGILIGLLFGCLGAAHYAWLPITAGLAEIWFAAGLVEGLGLGILFSLIHKP